MKKGTMFCNRPNAVVGINRTARFSVISCGGQDNGDGRVQFPSPTGISERVRLDGKRMNIFLDVDDVYTRRLIERAFQHASRKNYFNISLGPGVGMDPIPIPDHCQFQWAEYERIDWHNGVFADGAAKKKHGASSYCIRKGISRKAQLAHYTNLHICKNPHSILKHAIPQTKVLDCWSVWEDGCTISNQEGLAGVVASLGSEIRNGVSSAQQNRRTRLDRCLVDTKTAMLDADHDFDTGTDKEAPIWILKGSTTNKGAGIYIVHLYEQVVDHCWSESEIREW